MDKINIFHIITDLKFGGAGRYLLELCRYIDKNRFNNTVVLPRGSILVSHIGQIEDIEIIEIDGIGGKSFSPKGTWELYSLLKKERPNVVHTHACLSARIAATILGIDNIIYTRHSLLPKSKGVKGFLQKTLNHFSSTKAIAISNAVYDNLIMEGVKPKNISLIYNGVKLPDKEYDRNRLRLKYGLSQDEIIITLVGRFDAVKGQDHLLNIAEILKMKNNNFKILFVGDGVNREALEISAKERKLPAKFLGHINEIDEIYVLSDIVVNTSNSEALSFVALEGFSYKRPIVAFDLDGINEVIDNGVDGYLVGFGDYEAFSNRLLELIEDENLRKSFGQAGYEKIGTKFSIEKMVKKIEYIYGG